MSARRVQTPRRATRADVDRIAGTLRAFGAVGRHHAMTKRDLLSRMFQGREQPATAERELRRCVSEAPGLGVPICSCADGYYIATRADDFEPCLIDLRLRIEELEKRRAAIRVLYDNAIAAGLF